MLVNRIDTIKRYFKLFLLLWMVVLSQSAWADYEIRLPIGAKTQAEIEAEKYDPSELVLVFDTAITGGAAGIGILAPVNITVDWGDKVANSNCPTVYTTTTTLYCDNFSRIGTKTVKITGTLNGLGSPRYEEVSGIKALTRVIQFGQTGLTSLRGAFSYAENLTRVPATLPPTVTDMAATFHHATKFNDPNVSRWNTQSVTILYKSFYSAKAFDQDLDRWDVSNVDNFGSMFTFASQFDGDVSTWDTSNAQTMHYMFWGATHFSSDISNWDVSKIDNMDCMFRGVQNLKGDWSGWDVSNVTSMKSTFRGVGTIQLNIGGWDVSNVKHFSDTFSSATVLDDLSLWDISNGVSMSKMFLGTGGRPIGIELWDTSNITDMTAMLKTNKTSLADLNLSCWNVAKIASAPDQFAIIDTLPEANWPSWGTTGCW